VTLWRVWVYSDLHRPTVLFRWIFTLKTTSTLGNFSLKRSSRLGAVLLALACTTALAQTPAPAPATQPVAAPGFEFTGAGVVTCKEMLALSQTPASALQFEQWLLGFLAAYNAYIPPEQRVKLPPSAKLMTYATDVCKANPNVRFISVASAALRQLGAKVPLLQ
jgi:hypothetical protein